MMAMAPLLSFLPALSASSRRKPALRPLLASGPWQPKQRSERIGRTSRLKSTVAACFGLFCQMTTNTTQLTKAAKLICRGVGRNLIGYDVDIQSLGTVPVQWYALGSFDYSMLFGPLSGVGRPRKPFG